MRKFIFIWFVASLVLMTVIGALGVIWTGPSIALATWNFYGSGLVNYGAQTAALTFDNGGAPALYAMEKRIDPEGRMHFFVFDSELRELGGRQGPAAIRILAARIRPQEKAQFMPVDSGFMAMGRGFLAGSMITTHDGRSYRIIMWFPTLAVLDTVFHQWGWWTRIVTVVAGAALLCCWLAWRLSMPLTHLRNAARKLASGDLTARAGASTFPRRPPEYAELARDFDEMAGRIEMLVKSQRQLLRDVSHELRTPLTRLNLAVNNARHAPAAVVERCLDRVDQESERVNALIERILHLSRLEAFIEPPQHDAIEFGDFIESIVSDANFEANACNRKVSLLRAEACCVSGDRELLREALENVVRNAIRYTPERTEVTVDAYRGISSGYHIAIRDHGPGVALDHIEAIFEPFYRTPKSHQDSAGFGIGLAIAKRAVSLHRGTISARNCDEGGFELAIYLPIRST